MQARGIPGENVNAVTKHEGAALLPTAAALRLAIHYDPETGLFTRVKNSSWAKAGDPAGCLNGKGYVEFNLFGRLWRANRLAWLYVHGSWPKGMIDHKDGNKANNAIDNLRDVPNRTNTENRRHANRNNTTGFLGVRLHKATGKYEARIGVNGSLLYLGLHETPELAHSAYVAAKRLHHAGNML
jgi:hypothetical protein